MMLLWCDVQPFEDVERWDDVTRILLTVKAGQHELRFQTWSMFRSSRFYAEHGQLGNYREFFELLELLVADDLRAVVEDRTKDPAALPEARVAVIGPDQGPAASVVLAFREAAAWCNSPLVIWMDNDADAVLVRCAASAYGLHTLQVALDRGWARVVGCGGGGEIKNRARQWEVQAPLPRCLAIVDSDRQSAGPPSANAEAIKEIMRDRAWILARRELENYLPGNLVLNCARPTERQQARAFKRMGAAQTAFVDVETHLPPRLIAETTGLLDTVGPDALEAWVGDELHRVGAWIIEWL